MFPSNAQFFLLRTHVSEEYMRTSKIIVLYSKSFEPMICKLKHTLLAANKRARVSPSKLLSFVVFDPR